MTVCFPVSAVDDLAQINNLNAKHLTGDDSISGFRYNIDTIFYTKYRDIDVDNCKIICM